ncbi:MAG TPA: hypothetical protein VIU33_03775 [Nitrospiria bacterium]
MMIKKPSWILKIAVFILAPGVLAGALLWGMADGETSVQKQIIPESPGRTVTMTTTQSDAEILLVQSRPTTIRPTRPFITRVPRPTSSTVICRPRPGDIC